MRNYWKHFKTITKHKFVVMWYCWKLGLFWQGLVHDNSKYSPKEFMRSAKYFQGTGSPIDVEKKELGYSYAWQNHHNKNRHHWEYWTDWKNTKVYGVKMPYKYVLEMAADFIGAGKVYGGKNWTKGDPLDYHLKTKDARVFHEQTNILLGLLFSVIADHGLTNGIKLINKNKKIIKKYYAENNIERLRKLNNEKIISSWKNIKHLRPIW